jgi:hypothetical protein
MSSMVMIKCALTLKAVPTGFLTDILSLEQLKNEYANFNCPACGRVHRRSLNEAWLAEFEVSAPKGSLHPRG